MSRHGEQLHIFIEERGTDPNTGELDTATGKSVQLKALSLRQPYANWVADGSKTLETRTWHTHYRGDLLICASQSGKGEPKGMAVCLVQLVDVRPMQKKDEQAARVEWSPRLYVWKLTNRRVFKDPFPVKGRLGLFNIEVDNESLSF